MTHDQVFVADLGSSKIVALAASLAEDGQLLVDGFAVVPSRGIFKGNVSELPVVAETLDRAFTRLEAEIGHKIEHVAVSISGTHLQSSNSQSFIPIYPQKRAIKRQDVHQLINNSRQVMMPPDREQIMAVPREFRIDGQRGVTRPIGMPASRLDVITHIITGKIEPIDKIEKLLSLHGRHLDLLVASPLAAGLGVLSQDLMEAGVAVVDIGATTTEVGVFSAGSIAYVACIGIGSHHITSDISQLLKVSMEEAERLKIEHGTTFSATVSPEDVVEVRQESSNEKRPMKRKVLADIIEARSKEIATLVQEHIGKSGLASEIRGGVILTGGGTLLAGSESFFGEFLAPLKVKSAHPKLHGPHSRQVGTPTMSVAIGLARYALEGEDQEFVPVSGIAGWKDKIRSLTSLFGGKTGT